MLKKLPDAINLISKIEFNCEIIEAENKIPSITGLVLLVLQVTAALNTKTIELENKIPNFSNLVNADALKSKDTEIKNKILHSVD